MTDAEILTQANEILRLHRNDIEVLGVSTNELASSFLRIEIQGRRSFAEARIQGERVVAVKVAGFDDPFTRTTPYDPHKLDWHEFAF